ncbi:hypothetical protein FHG87_016302, partial [Trinorchestia longiramus]
MNSSSVVILLFALAGANALFSGCSRALSPTPKEFLENEKAKLKCIQKKIMSQATATVVSLFLPEAIQTLTGLEGGFFEDMPTGFQDTSFLETLKDPAQFLENMNLIGDAEDLRKCIAKELDQVCKAVNFFGFFDNGDFQDSIMAKVEGTDLEANVEKGIDNCGKVEDYNVS